LDKKSVAGKFDWVPDAMPGVARLVSEKRRAYGAAHVKRCWSRAMAGEAGWFFAREGAIAIGTPWDDPALANFAALSVTATQALVVMRGPEVADGA
jgi:hypothetical protein